MCRALSCVVTVRTALGALQPIALRWRTVTAYEVSCCNPATSPSVAPPSISEMRSAAAFSPGAPLVPEVEAEEAEEAEEAMVALSAEMGEARNSCAITGALLELKVGGSSQPKPAEQEPS